jgi:GNAT superfamily N-acetyltransferase
MRVWPLTSVDLAVITQVMATGRPWLPEYTDYWLWKECFGGTSFVAFDGDQPAGGVLACVDQSRQADLYIDQVAVDPAWRGRGVTRHLIGAVEAEARKRRCTRLWLSTDPVNPAIRAWQPLGFVELGVRQDFKGPGKDRAIFEKRLA